MGRRVCPPGDTEHGRGMVTLFPQKPEQAVALWWAESTKENIAMITHAASPGCTRAVKSLTCSSRSIPKGWE